MYSYHPDEPSYLSQFELGFKGWFECSKVDHNRRDRQVIEIFYKELSIHKPHMNIRRPYNQVSDMGNTIIIGDIYNTIAFRQPSAVI